MKILLQPCANPDAQKHFEDTIRSPASLNTLARYLSADELNRLRPHARNDGIMTWGLTPATDDSSVGMWERLSSGDFVAFFADREVFFVGRICDKVRNRQLALALWDTQPDGQTWELVYFLDPGQHTSFPLANLTGALGYQSDLVLRARLCDSSPSAESLFSSLTPAPAAPTVVSEPEDGEETPDDGAAAGQSFQESQEVRRAVELAAMARARTHYEASGWNVEDVSLTRPYDLLCRRGAGELHVEVKGTASAGHKVLLTRNEVSHAEDDGHLSARYVLRNVEVTRSGGEIVASGGNATVIDPWMIDRARLRPITYEYDVTES